MKLNTHIFLVSPILGGIINYSYSLQSLKINSIGFFLNYSIWGFIVVLLANVFTFLIFKYTDGGESGQKRSNDGSSKNKVRGKEVSLRQSQGNRRDKTQEYNGRVGVHGKA